MAGIGANSCLGPLRPTSKCSLSHARIRTCSVRLLLGLRAPSCHAPPPNWPETEAELIRFLFLPPVPIGTWGRARKQGVGTHLLLRSAESRNGVPTNVTVLRPQHVHHERMIIITATLDGRLKTSSSVESAHTTHGGHSCLRASAGETDPGACVSDASCRSNTRRHDSTQTEHFSRPVRVENAHDANGEARC